MKNFGTLNLLYLYWLTDLKLLNFDQPVPYLLEENTKTYFSKRKDYMYRFFYLKAIN